MENPHSLDEVARFMMILEPQRANAKNRLCIIGKKRLPDVKTHERCTSFSPARFWTLCSTVPVAPLLTPSSPLHRFFGFVQKVSDKMDDLLAGLGERAYETKTRGTRHEPAAHALGEGTYAIGKHAGDSHTHFSYVLLVRACTGSEIAHTLLKLLCCSKSLSNTTGFFNNRYSLVPSGARGAW